jgi:hypothetical protein
MEKGVKPISWDDVKFYFLGIHAVAVPDGRAVKIP